METQSPAMGNRLRQIDKVLSFLENVLLVIALVYLVLVFLSVLYGVISREFFQTSALWTNDFSGYVMLYCVFLSAPWVLRKNAHVHVDIFTSNLIGRAKRINTIIIAAVSIISMIILFWFSLQSTIDYLLRGTVMLANVPWPKFALVAPIPVGFLFLILRYLFILIIQFTKEADSYFAAHSDEELPIDG
ncbi:TRAP transporter small permease [Neobacillus sp. YX16]|uniref:TRAP transporter small permease n=1 Tax=Neobacillus sp. YX16 TaxID=3047874 RepID=UPI0024C363D6|nr:TRAP transporter small permease [Neobacillus sp. YX16]WHZ00872.1 TRAP transporter small permease [Neobacillus sp. YX16]